MRISVQIVAGSLSPQGICLTAPFLKNPRWSTPSS